MTQSIELVKGELALAKTELLEKARLYSSIEYSGGFESTWSASDGRRVFGIRQARRLAEGHSVIHSPMTIEKRIYSFVLTIISIHFALSVFGCHKSKNSTAETQKALKSQTGLASFYGSAFYGKKTASGERFDQTDWVAAHPSYPLGTVARVTNLKNNKSIEVRIIDRGPTRVNHSKGIIIDLSKSAAQDLGFIHEGRAHVRVEVLEWGRGPE